MSDQKPTIGVFFGSRAPEHDVSIITGTLICQGLLKLGYPVVPVYIDKKGQWLVDESLGRLASYTGGGGKQNDFSKFAKYNLDLEASVGKIVLSKKGLTGKSLTIDVAFPAFHGLNGEDGAGMGLFAMFGLPFIGCDHTSSGIAMDKVLTKIMYEQLGFKTAKFKHFLARQWQADSAKILADITTNLRYPLFVKPARLGSSIGIAKANDEAELKQAIEVALHYEEKVLVEEGVSNMKDLTIALLGDAAVSAEPTVSLVQDALYGEALFSYEDKYIADGGAQLGEAVNNLVIPADLPEAVTKEAQRIAAEVFVKFGCSGIARVDFLYDSEADELYVNEINTLPGNLYAHLWDKSGIPQGELLERLIKIAQARHEREVSRISTFDSTILTQLKGGKLGGSKLGS